MSDIAIKVENLSKFYRLGSGPNGYRTIRESIVEAAAAPFRRLSSALGKWSAVDNPLLPIAGHQSSVGEAFWALKDISFEVSRGEVVGIIGRNGAGKSTLLKILSRITEPTAGSAEIHGRVGSLLEVGTGFHYELTGRENIQLSGAIMGMSRSEISRKFDKIAAFGEVERFLDTPVKHYSSGMYMRLAFAVAAHLDTEVLLVDEVLAVGDAAFQKKCLGKMGEVAKEGRTVLFVSHNMGAVQQLCTKGILLEQGAVSLHGKVTDVVSQYLNTVSDTMTPCRSFSPETHKPLQILHVAVMDEKGQVTGRFNTGAAIFLEVEYQVHDVISGSNLAILVNRNGTDMLGSFDTDSNPTFLSRRSPGIYRYRVHLPSHLFKDGLYTIHIDVGFINRGVIEKRMDAVSFAVEELSEDTSFKGYAAHRYGILRLPVFWEVIGLR